MRLAWVDEPARLVLNTTKSLVQSGAAFGSNENFAGYRPAPTLAPDAPKLMLQSPVSFDDLDLLFFGADASCCAMASSDCMYCCTVRGLDWLARQAFWIW